MMEVVYDLMDSVLKRCASLKRHSLGSVPVYFYSGGTPT